jgi:hypothetical protein
MPRMIVKTDEKVKKIFRYCLIKLITSPPISPSPLAERGMVILGISSGRDWTAGVGKDKERWVAGSL